MRWTLKDNTPIRLFRRRGSRVWHILELAENDREEEFAQSICGFFIVHGVDKEITATPQTVELCQCCVKGQTHWASRVDRGFDFFPASFSEGDAGVTA